MEKEGKEIQYKTTVLYPSVMDAIVGLAQWTNSMKGKRPDYCVLSEELTLRLWFELGDKVTVFYGMKVVTIPHVAADFLQVGFGNAA